MSEAIELFKNTDWNIDWWWYGWIQDYKFVTIWNKKDHPSIHRFCFLKGIDVIEDFEYHWKIIFDSIEMVDEFRDILNYIYPEEKFEYVDRDNIKGYFE